MTGIAPPTPRVLRNEILTGDALTRLRELPDGLVDAIITSPPYFRLRQYGHTEQIGLEEHVDDWVAHLRTVMAECARVLVPTGTVWLNLGDTYSTHARQGSPRKSLLLGPERLAMLLVADGWTIRNKIVWAKTNTIPTSVRDRFATRHEVIYLLTRQPSYYFDLDALREPHTSRPPRPRTAAKKHQRAAWLGPNSDGDAGLAALHAAGLRGHPLGKNPGDVWPLGVSTYRGAHFATYPEQLARRMVLAGSPRLRCTVCRAPWTRGLIRDGPGMAHREPPRPTCNCDAVAEPGLVLDPFLGSGTTAIAAAKLGRDWLGIELNPDYVALAYKRISDALTKQPSRPGGTHRKEVT
jgi:site-specific DNA-methyltransferase (adenine-specific)